MDLSTTTLVNPEDLITRFVFSKNSTLNANLVVNGRVRYVLSSNDSRDGTKTKVLDVLTQQELVSMKMRTLLPDKIGFSRRFGGKEQKLSRIMEDHKLDDGFPVHLVHTNLGDFYWKLHPVYRLAFFAKSDPVHPVAYRESIMKPISTFALVINRELESLTDYIITTFLVLERRMRMVEKGGETADGKVCVNRTVVAGFYI